MLNFWQKFGPKPNVISFFGREILTFHQINKYEYCSQNVEIALQTDTLYKQIWFLQNNDLLKICSAHFVMNYRYVKIFKLLYNSYFSFTYNFITFFILYLVLHNAVQYARYGLHNIVTYARFYHLFFLITRTYFKRSLVFYSRIIYLLENKFSIIEFSTRRR